MDGLFFACLMGICGVTVDSGAPGSPDQAALAEKSHRLSGSQNEPAAVESLLPISEKVGGEVTERPAPREIPRADEANEDVVGAGRPSKADIAQVVRRKSAGIRHCYELGLVEDAHFNGTVEVQWRINTSGRVGAVKVVNATRTNRTVEACLLGEISQWEFAPSSEPIVVGAYPFTFDSTLLARHPARDKTAAH